MLLLEDCKLVGESRNSFADKNELVAGGRELFPRRVGSLGPGEDVVAVASELFARVVEPDLDRGMITLTGLETKCAVADFKLLVAKETPREADRELLVGLVKWGASFFEKFDAAKTEL